MQISTFLSTNGCRKDTKNPFLIFSTFINLQNKSAAAQFLQLFYMQVIKKAFFCYCMRILHTKHEQNPIFVAFSSQVLTSVGRNKTVQEMFTFLFAIVQNKLHIGEEGEHQNKYTSRETYWNSLKEDKRLCTKVL